MAVCAGFQHWTAPSGRAGGRPRGVGPGGGVSGSGLGLPLGLGGGGAQTGNLWSCAQHSGCRLYMGRRLEEIRWSPSNGTVQRSNPSNVPQDNHSAHVTLNRRRWGQARSREQRASRRRESEGEKGTERETEKEECALGVGWEKRGERRDTRRKTERDIQRKTHTERGRNRNRETKIRTKRQETNRRKRWREVATYTHTPTGAKEIQTHKKPFSDAKKGKEKCKIKGEAEGRGGRPVRADWVQAHGDTGKGMQRKERELASGDLPASSPLPCPQF